MGPSPLCSCCLSLLLVLLGGCGESPLEDSAGDSRPRRVVSLDYCADQYLLQLADREQILALSPDATSPFSYLREQARDMDTVRAVAEDVLILNPDLIIRSYGGGATATAFFERAGVPVLQLPWIQSVDGDDEHGIPGAIRLVAARLQQTARGDALIGGYRQRLARLRASSPPGNLLYMSAGGYTSGPGTLIHDMIATAGLANYMERPGWHPLPLETMVYETPDRVGAAFFRSVNREQQNWSASRHPVATALRDRSTSVVLDGASTACGGWFIADAMEALHSAERP